MEEISGYLDIEECRIVFSLDDFKVKFFNSSKDRKSITIPTDSDGYIWGTTYDNRIIAIYSRESISFETVKILRTWNYFVSEGHLPLKSINRVNQIRFYDGFVKSIFPCNALQRDSNNENPCQFVYEYKKDCKKFPVNISGENTTWSFSSVINEKDSIDNGISLSNSTSVMEILFEKSKNIGDIKTFWKYTRDLCAFLTFRNDVYFEKIELLYDDYHKIGVFFVKTDTLKENRKFVNTISVRWIEEVTFGEIMLNIITSDKEHRGLPMMIIPRDKNDVMYIDPSKIRTICSAIEMEMDLDGVDIEIPSEIEELKKKITAEVKNVRDNSDLENKCFDSIFPSISHWGQPLAMRIQEAWRQHSDEISELCKVYQIDVGEEEVKAFVKARNGMTHSGVVTMDDKVANTAFILLGLIYCCTLKRVKASSELIKDIMKRRFIG